MNRVTLYIILIFLFFGCRKSDYLLENESGAIKDNGSGVGTTTWTSDKEYLIEGYVFVNDGQVLTIEAGTVIKFREGQAENASALIVSRGGKIIANGTKDRPIIFTSEKDDLNGSIGDNENGLWGGLIILGNAPINYPGGETSIEGIPIAEPRGVFGGIDEDDNSGVLRYISIRHGGTNIGEGNEINGLTLGGVGRNTEIDFIEVYNNSDDGVEIFGGTVNLEHIVVSHCDDDAFDYDMGWTGKGQFWLGVQESNRGDNLIEGGSTTTEEVTTPYSQPSIFNATLIGNGNSNGNTIKLEKNGALVIANSLFVNKQSGVVLEVENEANDSYSQWIAENTEIKNNIFYDIASNNSDSIFVLTGDASHQKRNLWRSYYSDANNEIKNPLINPAENGFVPQEKLKGNLATFNDEWFQIVNFKGAFGEDNWIDKWTLLAQ